ncbi:MAG TPA: PmeII family type II restriction endonuclease [Candidatus Paceibacterota bacterium]|nr:PmeII family type II restriction endonuclease [Candidatus Paceibacterota bacterium]
MKELQIKDVVEYVEENIGGFHSARLESLSKLKLKKVLIRKNPYLFKAKNILTSEALVKTILDAHLSSQEETMFGDFLEGLAIFISGKVYDGAKSVAEGIDLEFEKDGVKYIVAIKSGPNWGNSSQITKMKENFRKAKKVFATSGNTQNIIAVNGCCYGRDNQPDKEEYKKLCGQRFWEFISGVPTLYVDIVEPLGHKAKEKNEEFLQAYAQIINKFTSEFSSEYCDDGVINWERLVKLNSSSEIEEEPTPVTED